MRYRPELHGLRAAWIGQLSYGAYLVHPLPLLLIPAHPAGIAYRCTVLLRLACIFILAAASYYAVEQPFLRLKRRFERDLDPGLPAGGNLEAPQQSRSDF